MKMILKTLLLFASGHLKTFDSFSPQYQISMGKMAEKETYLKQELKEVEVVVI